MENYLTKEGYEALQNRLNYLKTERRNEVASKLQAARELGDLSENAEYDSAKDEQAMLESEIYEIENKLRTSTIIDEKEIDTSKALEVDGIEAIYTYKDVPQKRFTMAGQTFPEPSPYDRLILDQRLRFVGDAVAIVAGENEKVVDEALKLIKVKYEVLEPVLIHLPILYPNPAQFFA